MASKMNLSPGVVLPLVGGALGGIIGFGEGGPGRLGSALLGAGAGVFVAAFMGSYGAVPTHRVGAGPESRYNRIPYEII